MMSRGGGHGGPERREYVFCVLPQAAQSIAEHNVRFLRRCDSQGRATCLLKAPLCLNAQRSDLTHLLRDLLCNVRRGVYMRSQGVKEEKPWPRCTLDSRDTFETVTDRTAGSIQCNCSCNGQLYLFCY